MGRETNKTHAGHNIELPIGLNCDVSDEKNERKREGIKVNMKDLIVELVGTGMEFQKALREKDPEKAVLKLLKQKKHTST